jgi:transketolase
MLRRPVRATIETQCCVAALPSVSLEAGATLGWTKYVDQAIGIDSFGMSAPGSYVMDYFNINAATLVAHVHEALGDAQ